MRMDAHVRRIEKQVTAPGKVGQGINNFGMWLMSIHNRFSHTWPLGIRLLFSREVCASSDTRYFEQSTLACTTRWLSGLRLRAAWIRAKDESGSWRTSDDMLQCIVGKAPGNK